MDYHSVMLSSKGESEPLHVDRLREECVGDAGGGLRWIRYGFINEHQAGEAAPIACDVDPSL